ncbi:hypothetical protein K2173_010939 [Erythroxylum novogranatense]|uniref:Uncharacterized protein n=1 Tax=Erythroxylum novogranatense TaxID=1862640 RepID=A0AAV8T1D1_9ROSI|nr:hypothetical protein K2173_010939 [Erythroxylum novogranatense]
MEEVSSSNMISNVSKVNFAAEVSDENDSNYGFRASKRPRLDNDNANVAKFKGVVPQQNGNWGAQIYANHHRVWLGTFKSEKEAAMAYDSASIKLRGGDSYRNLPWTDRNIREPNFQNHYTTEAILSMIKDGSYQSKFADFLRLQSKREEDHNCGSSSQERVIGDHGRFSCVQLFQKELTPSDVGKLNRLVIPKKFAVKYFPFISEVVEDDRINEAIDDLELVFYDRLMKVWKFRYCYWRSSQSFVFTRGWNRYVKEKKLKEKDIVSFYTCVFQDSTHESQHFSMIDITPSTDQAHNPGEVDQMEKMQKELGLSLGQCMRTRLQKEETPLKQYNVVQELESKTNMEETGLKLFGVRIK